MYNKLMRFNPPPPFLLRKQTNFQLLLSSRRETKLCFARLSLIIMKDFRILCRKMATKLILWFSFFFFFFFSIFLISFDSRNKRPMNLKSKIG